MPYNSYTNASDDQFAGQLDDYKLGLTPGGGSDYDNAVAGFNVLPESMAVGKLMELRGKAHADSLQTRVARAKDFSAMEDEDQFQGFSERISGLQGEDRAKAIQQEFSNNPSLARNKDVLDTTKGLFESDEYSLNARDKMLRAQKQRLEERLSNEDEANLDDIVKSRRLALDNGLQQGLLTSELVQTQREKIAKGQLEGLGSYIASSEGFKPEEKEHQDRLIQVAAHFSEDRDNEENRSVLNALTEITGALGQASKMPEVYRAKIGQYAHFTKKLKTAGMDLENLPEDPVERQAVLAAAAKEGVGLQGKAAADYKDLMASVGALSRSQQQVAETKQSFFEVLGRIDKSRSDASPEAKLVLKNDLALLKAKAPIISAGYRDEVERQASDLKRRDKESAIEGRLGLAKQRARSSDQKDRALGQAEYRAEMQNSFRAASTRDSRIRLYTKVAEDGMFDLFGFEKDPSPDEFLSKIESLNPIPRSAPDYE